MTKLEELLSEISTDELLALSGSCKLADPRYYTLRSCVDSILVGVTIDCELINRKMAEIKAALDAHGVEVAWEVIVKWKNIGR